MNITITIQNPTQDAILALANVVTSYHEQAAAMPSNEEPKIGTRTEPQSQDTSSNDKPKRARTNSTKPTPQPEAQPEPEEDNSPGQSGDSANSDDTPKYVPDVVEIRAKAQEVGVTPEGKKAIKALLTKFGVPSVSAIPEDKRAEFLDELNSL